MENQEGIEKLFFELASESRMSILRQLHRRNWKMHELGDSLDLTPTETFRQLQRLSKEAFTAKDADASYSLTPFGKLVLLLSPSFEFTFKYRQYFLEHDIWQLPPEFIFRIGELNGGTLKAKLPEVVKQVEEIIKNTQDHIWTLTSQVFATHGRTVEERFREGVKFRSIHPKEMLPFEIDYSESTRNIERRYLPKVPIVLVVTEKEAMMALPFIGGNVDLAAFFGRDPSFMKWATDLYMHYWEQGETVHKNPTMV